MSKPKVTFGPTEYREIKRALSFRSHNFATAGVLFVAFFLFFSGARLAQRPEVSLYLLSQLMLAIAFFQGFSLLHECGHGSASPQRWLNTLVGHLASVLCFLPFYPWRDIHREHHVWVGNIEKDPTYAAAKRWIARGRVPWVIRLAWRSWIPLAALVQHVVFWAYPVRLARSGVVGKGQLIRCAGSVLFLPSAYLLLFWWQPLIFRPSTFALGVGVYLFVVELVNLPHHLGTQTTHGRLPPWEQWRSSRSCVYPLGISEFVVLNFNFHVEHHLFPSLPWYRLRQARGMVRHALGGLYPEEVGISWNLRNRRRDMEAIVLVQDFVPVLEKD